MKLKERLKAIGAYLLARSTEASTYRGLVMLVGAGSWAKLDGSNKGELIMAVCLMLAGAVQAAVPNAVLYKK
jgi:hypothetical protein